MCSAPKPPPVKEDRKPEFLRNRFLDAAIGQGGIVGALRTGRSSLRIPLASPTATPDAGLGPTGTPPSPAPPVPARIQPIAGRRGGGSRVSTNTNLR